MTTALYVTLVLDRYDGAGNPVVRGTATLAPSLDMPDPADRMLIGQAPLSVAFRAGSGPPSQRLVSTDSIGPQPKGWTWNLSYDGVPGSPAPASYYVPAGPASFTATDASPAVFTWTPTASLTVLPDGTGVELSGGSLPGGFTAGTTYFVAGVNGTTFGLAATQGGSPLASTSAGSGSLTVVQYSLSALATAPAAQPGQQYLPQSAGTPSAGEVPVFTGEGYATVPGFGAGDKNYVQEFSVASTVIVPHNLGKYPSVTIFDSAGDEVDGDVAFTDLDNLTLTFSAPFSGTVTCN